MNTYGTSTPLTRFLTMESHKLHREFNIASGVSLYNGQPVKLNTTGELVALAAADNNALNVGVCIFNRPDGLADTDFTKDVPYKGASDRMTVAMRGYTTVQVEAGAANLPAGPVKFSALSTAKVPRYVALAGDLSDVGSMAGWNLTPVAAIGDVIEVVLV